MKVLKKVTCKIYFIIYSSYILFINSIALAAGTETETEFGKVSGLEQYVAEVFRWGRAIITSLAILMITFAGYRYMTSTGNPEQAERRLSVHHFCW